MRVPEEGLPCNVAIEFNSALPDDNRAIGNQNRATSLGRDQIEIKVQLSKGVCQSCRML